MLKEKQLKSIKPLRSLKISKEYSELRELPVVTGVDKRRKSLAESKRVASLIKRKSN